MNHVLHVVGQVRFGGHDACRVRDRRGRWDRSTARRGGVVAIVLRQEAQQLADHAQAVGVVGRDEVPHAADGVVGHRAAQLFLGHVFVGDGLDHVRAGHEHVAGVRDHEDEVGDGGRVDRAARARAHDGRDLRHHAARERVAQENIRVARQRDDAFLNARAAGIVQADDRARRSSGRGPSPCRSCARWSPKASRRTP